MMYIGQRGCGYTEARELAGFWKVRTTEPVFAKHTVLSRAKALVLECQDEIIA